MFESWDRRGIAHFRQPHNFLGLARDVLLEQAPDLLEAVVELGTHWSGTSSWSSTPGRSQSSA